MKTAEEFIAFFEAIPDEEWIIGRSANDEGTKFCAIGHIMCKNSKSINALSNLFIELSLITWINDGFHPRYQQETPKARILAVLNDIKNLPIN